VFERSSRRFRHNRRESGRPSLRHEDTVSSRRFGGPDDGTEILRIFHTIQDYQQRRLTPPASRFQNFLSAAVCLRRDKGDDALVIAAGDEAIEGRGRLDMDGNLPDLGLLNDLCELPVSPLNDQALKWPPAA
jgi:hypothetical protein